MHFKQTKTPHDPERKHGQRSRQVLPPVCALHARHVFVALVFVVILFLSCPQLSGFLVDAGRDSPGVIRKDCNPQNG